MGSLSESFAASDEYADLTRNVYADAGEVPSTFEMRGRIAHQIATLVDESDEETPILYNLFAELYALAQVKEREPGWTVQVALSICLEETFTHTHQFHEARKQYLAAEGKEK